MFTCLHLIMLAKKIDVLDLLISVISGYEKEQSNLVHSIVEHEKRLGELISRLEETQ